MRSAPMITIPLDDLVRALQADPLAYNARWAVYCETCARYYNLFPDRGGILCGECQTPLVALVALVAVTELMRM